MSYNITNWKTKKIRDLVIPIKAFYLSDRRDWHPRSTVDLIAKGGPIVTLKCGCGQTIMGLLVDGDKIAILTFDMSGEGSGNFMQNVLETALQHSTGELEAILIWEGGNSISKLTVKEGKVKKEPYEL